MNIDKNSKSNQSVEDESWPQKRNTIIGVVLVKFGTGMIGCWGSINLYLLSYMHMNGQNVTKSTNSLMILATVIPMSVIILIAPALSNRFGYQFITKICAFLYLISPQILYFRFNLITLTIFGVLIPASSFAVSTIPVFNCMWTQFPLNKNTITSLAITCFAIGTIFWNFMFTLIVNPNNAYTDIEDQKTGMKFFGEEVSKNAKMALFIAYTVAGLMFLIGSFLIKKRKSEVILFEVYQGQIQNKKIEKETPTIKKSQQNTQKQQEKAIQESFSETNQIMIDRYSGEIYKLKKFDRDSMQDENDPLKEDQKNLSDKNLQQNLISKNQPKISLIAALRDWKFIFIFLISFFSGLYQVFLLMNIKIIYMPIVKDDYFIVQCAMVSTGVSIGGAFLWGYLGDKLGFLKTLLVFSLIDSLVKICGIFAWEKTQIMMLFIGIGLVDKAMLTIMGPGLVEMFGMDIATELLPYKGISIFFGFVFAPLCYIILSSFITIQQYLAILCIFSIVCIFLASKLYLSINK